MKQAHHTAITAADRAASKALYCGVLGFTLVSEAYREERDSWKGGLALSGQYMIEFFSFLFPPYRLSRPEVYGLRHLAFSVEDVEELIAHLEAHHVKYEPIHIDPFTGKRFTFFNDPNGLSPELCEM